MVTMMFSTYGDVVTVEELSEMLKIGRNTAYELVRGNIVKNVRVGRSIRIPKDAVIEYLTALKDKDT
jgi:excisionase family DNA binding protein